MRSRTTAGLLCAAWLAGCAGGPGGPAPAATAAPAAAPGVAPDREYVVLVAAEASDEVWRLRFGPAGGQVERTVDVGIHPADPDGPHGLALAPDRRHYYVTTAHGVPDGFLWKHAVDDDRVLGRVTLGAFPASLQVSPDGAYAWVVNFNLYGEMVPSSVSVVATAEMVEVARIATCAMPHGSRLDATGARHWSVCMMDDVLVEIDARHFEVARHFMLSPGSEHGMAGAPHAGEHAMHAAGPRCSPTWVAPAPDGRRIFVACNASNDIVEVDVGAWRMVRRIPAGEGVYNLAVTPDGRTLVATNKRGASVSLFDLASGRERARIPTLRAVVHGIAVPGDGRHAFVSVEGVGSEPGTVEMIDLVEGRRVAAVDVGQMAGGIDAWAVEPRPLR